MNMLIDTPESLPPAIEPEALGVFGDDPDKILRMLVTFCKVSPGLLADIRRGLAEADADKTRRAAHSMKSSNAMIGAKALAGICQELEILASMDQLADTGELAAALDAEFARVERDVATIMTERQRLRRQRLAMV